MKISHFEDLIAWQKSQELAVKVYKVFSRNKDFGFKNQICNAAVSISNNIAEGFEREGKKEFARFLIYVKGSCGEVRSMIYLAFRLQFINDDERDLFLNDCREISRIIKGLHKKVIAQIKV